MAATTGGLDRIIPETKAYRSCPTTIGGSGGAETSSATRLSEITEPSSREDPAARQEQTAERFEKSWEDIGLQTFCKLCQFNFCVNKLSFFVLCNLFIGLCFTVALICTLSFCTGAVPSAVHPFAECACGCLQTGVIQLTSQIHNN